MQSKNWDMDITLKKILNANEYCKVDRNYRLHKSDSCYRGYCMYLTHPNSDRDRKFETNIGVGEDGFMYIGDGCGNENLPLEKTKAIVKEMWKYKEWVNQMEDNKFYLLHKNGIDYDNLED